MFVAEGGQLSSALIVFRHQPSTNQERLDDLRHCSAGQTKSRSHHVQTTVARSEQTNVLLLGRSQSQLIQLFEIAGSFQMSASDLVVALGPTDPMTCLQQSESQARRPSGTLCNE